MSRGMGSDEILLKLDGPPKRVVSLVPSYTQSLFDLGFGDAVMGVTDFCTHPKAGLDGIPRIGGPRKLRVDEINQLRPDLILANQEENSREDVDKMIEAGLNVWVSFPHSVKELFTFLADLVRFFGDEAASMKVRMLETSFDWAAQAAAEQARMRYFCPIWQENGPDGVFWMTFNRQTYAGDLLDQLGGDNIFGSRERMYPMEADLGLAPAEDPGLRDTRYPRVRCGEVLAAQPEVILLPDEPFAFGQSDESRVRELLANTPAVKTGRVYRVEGRWISWYGTCIGEAISELPIFFMNSGGNS